MIRSVRCLAVLIVLSSTACRSDADEKAEVYSFTVPTNSMAPTLDAQQSIDATQVEDYSPRRGDIVIFRVPADWQAPGEGGGVTIKRVIAIGGDVVSCCSPGNSVHLNGKALDESAYRMPDGPASIAPFDVRVPDRDIWVMGDNRLMSPDSAFFEHEQQGAGFVPAPSVLAIYDPQ